MRWLAIPGRRAAERSRTHCGRLELHPSRAPHQVELEIDESARPERVGLGAHAEQAIAQAALSSQAFCTLCRILPDARPSIVVILLPTAALTGMLQERTAAPSRWTVQAPHWAMPQPYFVPVRPTCSRITQSKGVFGSTSTW